MEAKTAYSTFARYRRVSPAFPKPLRFHYSFGCIHPFYNKRSRRQGAAANLRRYPGTCGAKIGFLAERLEYTQHMAPRISYEREGDFATAMALVDWAFPRPF